MKRVLGPDVSGFVVLAVLSLLFAFGTPLYAVLFYLVPGYNQLHSAFRWVFPYTLSMAVLAGFGLDVLLRGSAHAWAAACAAHLGRALTVLAGLGCPGCGRAQPGPARPVRRPGQPAAGGLRSGARARGFADGAMAWSYEAVGLARFGGAGRAVWRRPALEHLGRPCGRAQAAGERRAARRRSLQAGGCGPSPPSAC